MLGKFIYLFNKKRGFDCIASGLIGDARKYLKYAHRYNPEDVEVGLALAKLFIDDDLLDEASNILKQYEYSEDENYFVVLGKLYESQGVVDKAFNLYSEMILKLTSGSDVEWYDRLVSLVVAFNSKLEIPVLRFIEDWGHRGFTPSGLYYSGILCTHIDDLEKAIDFFHQARNTVFDSYLCCQALGAAYYQLKDYKSAQMYFYEALSFKPNTVEPYVNLGKAFEKTDVDKAKVFFEKALEVEEDFFTLCSLANIEQGHGNNDLALKLLERAEDAWSGSKECAFSLGELYLLKEELDEAIYYFELALARDNAFVQAAIMLALVLERAGMVDDSVAGLKQFYVSYPSSLTPSFYINLAYLHEKLKNLDASIQCLKEGVERFPSESQLLNAYAVQLREGGEFSLAVKSIDQALAILPNDAIYLSNKAAIVADLGNYKLSQEIFAKAEAIEPENADTIWLKAIACLQYHDFQLGWKNYEGRWSRLDDSQKRPFDFPTFNSSVGGGALLVYREQGLGDELMFSSCLKDFSHYSSDIILECDPKLESLFRRSFRFVDIYASDDKNNIDWLESYPQIEQQIAIGSIPQYVRNKLEDFEKKSPFLIADNEKIEYWSETLNGLGEGLKVGISWRGGTYKTRKLLRSIDLPELVELLKVQGVHFINLQYGDVEEELCSLEAFSGASIHNFPTAIETYDETAALCCALDVVVSVQTAIVHLCGALGVPVWCMLPEVAEWRYGAKGSTMPWYESVRLFRQKGGNGWPPVINDIKNQLEKLRGSL